MRFPGWWPLVALAGVFLGSGPGAEAQTRAKAPVRFNRDVRPILSDKCFHCHGPDSAHRKAGLRLDTAEGAFADLGGYPAIVKGQPLASELWKRITATDPDDVMPPPDSGKKLTEEELDVVRRWIEQGAAYEPHWSYVPVARPPVPPGPERTPMDRYLGARLRDEGLAPAGDADRVTLARRLSFDLVGLPPRPEEIDAFVADRRPDAHERLVDRLLASPHFGERMALTWLDLVRYADSIGYHSDNSRHVAPYRDYVIRAFNEDKPFDRFTVEQLAGDLLPRPTRESRVASTYNMLLQTTEEGGAQAKEYEAKLAADRVRNFGSVWLGATLGCAQCHDHKYDPFTIKDFYTVAAFFSDLQENPINSRKEHLLVLAPAQERRLAQLDARLERARWRLEEPRPALAAAQAAWEERVRAAATDVKGRWTLARIPAVTSENGTQFKIEGDVVTGTGPTPDHDAFVATLETDRREITGLRLDVHGGSEFFRKAYARAGDGNFVLTEVELAELTAGGPRPVAIAGVVADYEQEGFPAAHLVDGRRDTGWAADGHRTPQESRGATNRGVVFALARPIAGGPGTRLRLTLRHDAAKYPRRVIARFKVRVTSLPEPTTWGVVLEDVLHALRVLPEDRSPAQAKAIAAYYRSIAPPLASIRAEIRRLEAERQDLTAEALKTLHSIPTDPRVVRVLPRGNWMDDSGEVVAPAVPHFLPQIAKPGRATRLDLAEWLVRKDNPLTARVFVNRLWKHFFGHGLSRSLEDLGAQGEWPSHPQLLDWLAAELMDGGWRVKRLVRLLVTSDAYRRTSTPTAEQKARDPQNRLFGRQTPFRLDAELVRDNALAVSGLLSPHVGGPSVKPYQPDGYWDALNFPKRVWETDRGEKGHRRGLYTHWQRTFLHPSLLAFDAPTREECTAERPRSNTPQQALALLNDPTYVEAARVFAERVMRQGGRRDEDRLVWAFRQATGRRPTAEEARHLGELHRRHRALYREDERAARALVGVGDAPAPARLDVVELAAWSSVTRALLNLHETITRH